MSLRPYVQELSSDDLLTLWDESIDYEDTGSLYEDSLARSIQEPSGMGLVSFVLYATVLFAEVWRELYQREQDGSI